LRTLKREAKSAFIFVLERGAPLHRALAGQSSPAGSGRRQRVGGHGNGKLIVTTQQFVEYGIHRRMVPAALRELAALGIICITVRGRGGAA
jgi:hypothetical protein